MTSIALKSVQTEVKRLISQTTDLGLLKQYAALRSNSDLLAWIDFLEALEHPDTSTALNNTLPIDAETRAALDDPRRRNLHLAEWCRVNDLMSLAAAVVYLVRVRHQMVWLTEEQQLVAQHELIHQFDLPVVYTDTKNIVLPAQPALVIFDPVSNVRDASDANDANDSDATISEDVDDETLFRVFSESMSTTSRVYYDRVKSLLCLPTFRGKWFSKGEVLRKLVNDSREMDTMRSATWLWTKRASSCEPIHDPEQTGLLMKQSSTGQWYFRWN